MPNTHQKRDPEGQFTGSNAKNRSSVSNNRSSSSRSKSGSGRSKNDR